MAKFAEPARVSHTELARAARLVRIRVPETEIERYCQELGNVVSWFNTLSEVDTSGVDPVLYGGRPGSLPTRDDVVDDGGIRDQVLACSEVGSEAKCFFVKKVIK
ncbi:Asp-tRNA(Asn)/Glu-tRNA(Gln) amidotransferase subunit GatC [Anaplasma capra]|uniref:Asp-tRNA(Asn)/Glu-tRNA(Gln) amidotransferase subunit GatC n=1 Tax=Anaplasma capra TaxID=1562740 RepID=UPI0021D5AACA|nr:Asp-tRNA(Asn)/Glu-tRNA(Gln) amidotransferase subunit GatC [Anaplasma capra]MCU7611787.1 aspartyl/glutamyl-tRNA amidotransferase subunit C [Anaplasma capra]MCU7612630.1 aspartyl/glutamyl-tRNA amidotransferase subunit C [Anaplasma capra]